MSGRANRVFGPLLPFTDSTAVVYLSIPVKGSVFLFFFSLCGRPRLFQFATCRVSLHRLRLILFVLHTLLHDAPFASCFFCSPTSGRLKV